MPRDEVIRIKVSPVIKTKFQTLCEALGMSESGLGAYIIGNFILQQEQVTKPLMDKLSATMSDSMKEFIAKQIDIADKLNADQE